MGTNEKLHRYLCSPISAAPLAVFRILFGALMLFSVIRFWYYGWIEKLYISPKFHFHYYGFEWVTVPGNWTYLLFIVCGLSAFFVSLGYKYRWAIIVFFLSFSYIELMDKTTYLNHYYFVSSIAFILIWLPANVHFSIDAHQNQHIRKAFVPRWTVASLQLMISIVYIYAGLAKLNYDWMVEALPLSIWLREKTNLALIGPLMDDRWLHYLFSWGGAIYDLCIVFLLICSRTRVFAFILVLFFHLITKILFPIGIFPYIMIVASLMFFGEDFHKKILKKIATFIRTNYDLSENKKSFKLAPLGMKITGTILILFFTFQILFPLRSHLYPGNVFWTEQGYRFSWRVMLMEKTGYANFKIVDSVSGKSFYVQNEDFLTPVQQKQMSTQADFMVEYAHFLGRHFASQGHKNLQIFVESYVSLNGRKSQIYIDPNVNLLSVENNLCHKQYILPLHEK